MDLSGLGLDAIEEKEGEFSIGCMCSLRQLETHEGLNRYFDGIFRECTRNIVGVQMRNCATVGGSIFARFGFSDILTCLLALDAYVELYHEGTILLSEFAARPVRRDQKDILVRIIIKKDGRKAAYTSQRNSRTDFPVIACCVSNLGNKWFVSVGARPAKAKAVIITEDDFDTLKEMAKEAAEAFTYGDNTRAQRCLQKDSGNCLHPPSYGADQRKERGHSMRLSFRLNGKQVETDVRPDMLLLDLVRDLGCYSVKRGCETANCGLCTVWLDGKPVLSCSTLAIRADGRHVTTLEGLQKEAEEFGMFLAREGGEQCGFCNPGFIMNVLAMEKELKDPDEEDIKEYLSGNLCRCSGYMSQLRAVKKYLDMKQSGKEA